MVGNARDISQHLAWLRGENTTHLFIFGLFVPVILISGFAHGFLADSQAIVRRKTIASGLDFQNTFVHKAIHYKPLCRTYQQLVFYVAFPANILFKYLRLRQHAYFF